MRKWLPLLTICIGTLMLLVDVTIVNVALPDMAVSLRTNFSSLQWVVDSYALVLAAFLLGIGSIADRLGHRSAYVVGLSLFALASAACGFAGNSTVLVAARAVQGLGGAAMFATTFALLNRSYTGRDRGTAYGIWGAVSGAAAAIGPIAGGLLTEHLSWRWIFFVNLPFAITAIVLCFLVLAESERHRSPLDLSGIATFTIFAAALTFGLIRANEHGWGAGLVLASFALSIVMLVAFIVAETRSDHPMLDLGLLRSGAFTGALIAGFVLSAAAFAYLTYTSIWLQSVRGMSPVQAGLATLPLAVASFVTSASIGRLMHGNRNWLAVGLGIGLTGAGGLLVAWQLSGASASWTALLPGLVVTGVGVGLAAPTLSSTAMSAVAPQRGGMAAGAVNTARQLGFALGIAALGTVFAARIKSVLVAHDMPHASGASAAVAGGQARAVLSHVPADAQAAADHLVHLAAVDGLRLTALVAGVLGVVGGVVAGLLIRPRRSAPASTPAYDEQDERLAPAEGAVS
ncbi:MFS transporter [Flexivirga caeni]|uniref:DHA2 family efflux MFS transporter permease subunit n=1 Tax=Flexivirga caeni TaxID=2294115 RepID=A0A3M9M3J8_9MICO|nr:MFS transporter [Flexivirga caeni]RNI19503.1 DHA2 family efflux MFS transporter permease subunit [Flexivirga caeni]